MCLNVLALETHTVRLREIRTFDDGEAVNQRPRRNDATWVRMLHAAPITVDDMLPVEGRRRLSLKW
jgi:hypothetical protein